MPVVVNACGPKRSGKDTGKTEARIPVVVINIHGSGGENLQMGLFTCKPSGRRSIWRVICSTNGVGPQVSSAGHWPAVISMDEHAAPFILKGPRASFDPTRLMMHICSGVGESLILVIAGGLPLSTGKDAIVCVAVANMNPIGRAEFLKGSLGLANGVAILILH